jgi:hypothetical protein
MLRGTTKSPKEKTMSFKFDPSKAVAPSITVKVRQECRDLDSSLSYIRDRLAEFKREKAKNEDYSCPWLKRRKDANGKDQLYVVAILKTMPIYWNEEFTNEKVKILNPDGTLREERRFMKGMSQYPVPSVEEGMEMLEALASGEDEALKERVARASEAYVDVVDFELPHIEQKAAMLYNESKWPETSNPDNDDIKYGLWDVRDKKGATRGTFSKDKTNKKNMFKQTARRQLGYARWNDVHKVAKA